MPFMVNSLLPNTRHLIVASTWLFRLIVVVVPPKLNGVDIFGLSLCLDYGAFRGLDLYTSYSIFPSRSLRVVLRGELRDKVSLKRRTRVNPSPIIG